MIKCQRIEIDLAGRISSQAMTCVKTFRNPDMYMLLHFLQNCDFTFEGNKERPYARIVRMQIISNPSGKFFDKMYIS